MKKIKNLNIFLTAEGAEDAEKISYLILSYVDIMNQATNAEEYI